MLIFFPVKFWEVFIIWSVFMRSLKFGTVMLQLFWHVCSWRLKVMHVKIEVLIIIRIVIRYPVTWKVINVIGIRVMVIPVCFAKILFFLVNKVNIKHDIVLEISLPSPESMSLRYCWSLIVIECLVVFVIHLIMRVNDLFWISWHVMIYWIPSKIIIFFRVDNITVINLMLHRFIEIVLCCIMRVVMLWSLMTLGDM